MSNTRYELLRKVPVSERNIHAIGHESVGGAIMLHLFDAEPLQISDGTFIPPWYETVNLSDIQLGYGTSTVSGTDVHEYIVERVTTFEGYVVRASLLDGDGHPIKSDYNILDRFESHQEAYKAREGYRKMEKYENYFIDVVPDYIVM